MKRTRAQTPKLQDPLDPSAAVAAPNNPKPQRRAKQPRQPKAQAGAGKKTSSAAAAAAAADAARDAVAAAASPAVSSGADTVATVPDVCCGGGGADELAAAQPGAEWEYPLDGGGLLSNSEGSWWTFGVDEEKLLGWFPFVDEDFFRCRGADAAAAAAAEFDDDIWRIHQIYEIPSYAAK